MKTDSFPGAPALIRQSSSSAEHVDQEQLDSNLAANRKAVKRPQCAFRGGWIVSIVVLFLGSTCSTASAQPVNIRATADLHESRISLGEQTVLKVEILNGDPEIIPKSIEASGLTITYQRDARQALITNGVGTTKVIIFYDVIGEVAGTHLVPAINVRVDGKQYQTKPQEINVTERDDPPDKQLPGRWYSYNASAVQTEPIGRATDLVYLEFLDHGALRYAWATNAGQSSGHWAVKGDSLELVFGDVGQIMHFNIDAENRYLALSFPEDGRRWMSQGHLAEKCAEAWRAPGEDYELLTRAIEILRIFPYEITKGIYSECLEGTAPEDKVHLLVLADALIRNNRVDVGVIPNELLEAFRRYSRAKMLPMSVIVDPKIFLNAAIRYEMSDAIPILKAELSRNFSNDYDTVGWYTDDLLSTLAALDNPRWINYPDFINSSGYVMSELEGLITHKSYIGSGKNPFSTEANPVNVQKFLAMFENNESGIFSGQKGVWWDLSSSIVSPIDTETMSIDFSLHNLSNPDKPLHRVQFILGRTNDPEQAWLIDDVKVSEWKGALGLATDSTPLPKRHNDTEKSGAPLKTEPTLSETEPTLSETEPTLSGMWTMKGTAYRYQVKGGELLGLVELGSKLRVDLVSKKLTFEGTDTSYRIKISSGKSLQIFEQKTSPGITSLEEGEIKLDESNPNLATWEGSITHSQGEAKFIKLSSTLIRIQ